MARINNPGFYVNLIGFDRDEAAMLVSLLLYSVACYDESDLGKIFFGEGHEEAGASVREALISIGRKIDDDWDKMLHDVEALMAE